MEEQEYLQVIFDKLNSYLTNDDKNYDSSQMINSIISTIVQFFDCDYEKLALALDRLVIMKEENSNTKYADPLNRFDISDKTQLSVKGFLSKGQPNLFFYIGDTNNPYAIVKTINDDGKDIYSVEISNNPDVLLTYKKDASVLRDSYVYVQEFEYVDGKCLETTNMYAETIPSNTHNFISIDTIEQDSNDYGNFMLLLSNAMKNKGVDLTNISNFGSDILFLNFYDKIKELCGSDKILSLEDLIYLATASLYGESGVLKKESELIKIFKAEGIYSPESVQTRQTIETVINGVPISYHIVKSEGYLSIEAYNGNKKVCGSMVIASDEGFSMIRTFYNAPAIDEFENGTSFVINVNGNQVKFMTMDGRNADQNKKRTVESRLIFEDNGVIKLESSDKVTTNAILKQGSELTGGGSSMGVI